MMKKIISILALVAVVVFPALVLAQESVGGSSDVLEDGGRCYLNGVEVPCDELADKVGGFFAGGIIFILVFSLIGILAFIFWIMMLVHAIKYPIDNKALWLLLILLTGIIGAIVYYFAVKRDYKLEMAGPPSVPPPVAPPSNMPSPPTAPTQ